MTYRKQASGTCASHGMLAITTIAECDAAAAALSNADVTSTPTSMTPRPEGCYDNGDGLWLATNEANAGNGVGVGEAQNLICRALHLYTGVHGGGGCISPVWPQDGNGAGNPSEKHMYAGPQGGTTVRPPQPRPRGYHA